MEELVLTDPVVIPEKTTSTYRVLSLSLDWEGKFTVTSDSGIVLITLKDNNNERSNYHYEGKEAIDLMKWLNTANFTVNSMHKKILQKLSNDGFIPGEVTGTPDPPALSE